METFDVFVYGTLLVGERNHHVAKPHLLNVQQGKIKGKLYHVGPFPALVLDGKSLVHGEWFTVTKEGLKNMDWLEGYEEGGHHNHYERTWVKDVDAEREGYVYVYSKEQTDGLELIANGSWRRRAIL